MPSSPNTLHSIICGKLKATAFPPQTRLIQGHRTSQSDVSPHRGSQTRRKIFDEVPLAAGCWLCNLERGTRLDPLFEFRVSVTCSLSLHPSAILQRSRLLPNRGLPAIAYPLAIPQYQLQSITASYHTACSLWSSSAAKQRRTPQAKAAGLPAWNCALKTTGKFSGCDCRQWHPVTQECRAPTTPLVLCSVPKSQGPSPSQLLSRAPTHCRPSDSPFTHRRGVCVIVLAISPPPQCLPQYRRRQSLVTHLNRARRLTPYRRGRSQRGRVHQHLPHQLPVHHRTVPCHTTKAADKPLPQAGLSKISSLTKNMPTKQQM